MTDTDEDMVLCGRGLDKWYGAKHERRQVLFGVDVDVRAGECLAVIGGSGSGKTTLTRVLLGLESADGGSVEYCGEPVRGDVARKLRMQSGLVFQSPFDSLDPRWRIGRSIGEHCECIIRIGHGNASRNAWPKCWNGEPRSGNVSQPFPRRPVRRAGAARGDRPRHRGRAEGVARDEPMSAIDVAARVRILESFEAIRNAEPDMAIIMVSHDLGVVQHIADRILVLHDGRVAETGATSEVLGHPQDEYTKRLVQAASL